MKNYAKGLDITQKLIVRAPKIINDQGQEHQYESFKTALLKLPGIDQVTASYGSPGDHHGKGSQFVRSKKNPELFQPFTVNSVDYDYLYTYDVQLLHGRGFSREFPSDKNAAVITEDVALKLGFNSVEAALQEKLVISEHWWGKEVTIIGIVKRINLYSLRLEQSGVIFVLVGDQSPEYFTAQLSNISDLSKHLAQIEELYKSHFPGNPFEYFFLDEYFNAQYQAEEQFGKVFTAASSLAIFIACLGLFGLSSFMIKQRTKEIGIRKVLGAPVQSILLLLSSDYIKLIVLAGLIALPIAYFSLHQWLESYMVRITLSWWLFLMPVALVIFIALVTVSVQTIKAALANPAKSLQYE
jgi:putative ABC transport system permease protein